MKNTTTNQTSETPPVASSDLLGACVDFIKTKINEAEQTLKRREEMQAVWAGGTNETWKAVGCKKPKADRLKESVMHGRIAVRNREELQMFKNVLMQLQAPNAALSEAADKVR